MNSVSKDRTYPIIVLLFFLTGMAGLIYQVAWEKKLIDIFGISIYSVTIIIASFMTGLGFGSYFGGRWANRFRNPFVVYGILELAIGAYGLVSMPILQRFNEPSFLEFFGGNVESSSSIIHLLLAFLFFLIPTFIMGMTLPLLTQGLIKSENLIQKRVGVLYGVNTLGAACGSLIAGFVVIEIFGLVYSTWFAAFLNIAVALFVIFKFREFSIEKEAVSTEIQQGDVRPPTFLYLAYFLVGFLALAYEVFIFRYLKVLIADSTYTFPLMLFYYLLFIALGSAFSSKVLNVLNKEESVVMNRIGMILCLIPMSIFVIFCVTDYLGMNVFQLNYWTGAWRGQYRGQSSSRIALMSCIFNFTGYFIWCFVSHVYDFSLASDQECGKFCWTYLFGQYIG